MIDDKQDLASVLRRVQRLLAIAEDGRSNPNEAAPAARMAEAVVIHIGGARRRSLTVGAIGHANGLMAQGREGAGPGSELGCFVLAARAVR